jgi:DNA-binding HxlR family transcriptional regulator
METRSPKPTKKNEIPEIGENCPVAVTLKILGGKWRLLIINYLLTGKKRYGELRRLIPQISEKMLIQELRALEQVGMVERTVTPHSPPIVDYALTPEGLQLQTIVDVVYNWGQEYLMRNKASKTHG